MARRPERHAHVSNAAATVPERHHSSVSRWRHPKNNNNDLKAHVPLPSLAAGHHKDRRTNEQTQFNDASGPAVLAPAVRRRLSQAALIFQPHAAGRPVEDADALLYCQSMVGEWCGGSCSQEGRRPS